MDQKLIGEFISAKRKEKGLTQKELADKLRISEKTISKWETGHGLPEVSNLQPLCNELDITVTELLNGKESKKIREDKVVKYIEYKEKKNSKKMFTTIMLFTLIIAIVILLFSLFNNFNTVKVYELHGESEHFTYGTALVMDSNMKNMFVEGNLETKDNSIKVEDIRYIEYLCGDTLIVGHGYKQVTGEYYLEDNGYDEILDKEKLNNINDWKVVVKYDTQDGIKQETIPLKAEGVMINNKLFYKKKESIASDNDTSNYEKKQKAMEDELNKLEKTLKEHGFKQTNEEGHGKYTKEVKDGRFEVLSIIDLKSSSFEYIDRDYIVHTFLTSQVYMFVNKKDSSIGINYTRGTKKTTCSTIDEKNQTSIVECPKGIEKTIDKYIEIFDKEFEDIIPPEEQWYKEPTN